MEESKVINSDNTYNTDMSTSQSTIGGNSITNNKLNKDDLQEVTGGGGGGIVTPPTTILNGSGTLTPILLILGDGTSTPDVDEEPVLLEEDGDTTYKAVINQTYESNIPIITFKSDASTWCDANYVIAVTESDKTIPVSYNSKNLSTTFTNDGNNWCSVELKKPLEVTFPSSQNLKLTSDNFPDNSKIIVPVISCKENTGAERNTVITFNIGNFSILHNIKLSVTQNAYSGGSTSSLTPSILVYETINESTHDFTYKKYPNTEPLHLYYYKNNASYSGFLYIPYGIYTTYNLAWFGLLDSNGKADNNLVYTSKDQLEKYNKKFGCSISGLKIEIAEANAYIENTALTIIIKTTQTTEVNGDFKITYDGNFLCNVKKIEKDN